MEVTRIARCVGEVASARAPLTAGIVVPSIPPPCSASSQPLSQRERMASGRLPCSLWHGVHLVESGFQALPDDLRMPPVTDLVLPLTGHRLVGGMTVPGDLVTVS